jgi:hypothetical protein
MGNLKVKCLEKASSLISSFSPLSIEQEIRNEFSKEGVTFEHIKGNVLDAFVKKMAKEYNKIQEAKCWIDDVIDELKDEIK